MCKQMIFLISFVLVLGLAGSAVAIPVPAPWGNQDIGTNHGGATGSADWNPGTQTLTVVGDGEDIWTPGGDDFHYVYKPWSGDCELIARVVSFAGGTNQWRKAGVMVRQSLTDTSPHAMMVMTMGGGNGASFQWVDGTNNNNNNDSASSVSVPYYVRVTRSGQTFTGYYSATGAPGSWQQVGTTNFVTPMTSNCYIGICLTSHQAGTLTTAVFDSFGGDIKFGAYPYPSQPNPPDNATDVSVETKLTWKEGDYATIHKVYFGTDPCALPLVDTIPSILPAEHDPEDPPGEPNLTASTTYYWKVTETDGNMVDHEGPMWSFTTVSGAASPEFPSNGAMIVGAEYSGNIYTWLDYVQGATTVKWTGYCHEEYDKVLTRHQDANLGSPPYATMTTRFYVGLPIVGPYIESLERGKQYNWTVDGEDHKGNKFYGDIWMFAIQGVKAFSPTPPNEATWIPTDVVLSWLSGYVPTGASLEHDVYIGYDWDDVNDANCNDIPVPPEYMGYRNEPNYPATGLPNKTKVFWRIDEVANRLPPPIGGGEYVKGDIWCFETVPLFYSPDPNLLAWWRFDANLGTTAYDWTGNDNHGTMFGTTWASPGSVGSDYCMAFDGTNDYIAIQNLYYVGAGYPEATVYTWLRTSISGNQVIASYDRNQFWRLEINGSGAGPGQVGWDVMTSTGQVDYGSATRVDDGEWHNVAGVFDNGTLIIYIDGNPEPSASGGPTMGSSATRYGFLGVGSEASGYNGNRGPANYFEGYMDDFRIYDRALSQAEIIKLAAPLEAWIPYPKDGQANVPLTVTLQWEPGKYADKHDVYFGTDKASVEAADTTMPPIYKGRYDPNTYGPMILDSGKIYYWRIDEVNLAGPDPCLWKGDVWIFRAVGAAGGIRGDYYQHTGGASPPGFETYILTRIDPDINFNWGNGSPDANIAINDYSVRWSGHVEPLISGDWMFWTNTDDGVRLWIDDVLVIDDWEDQSPTDNNSPRIPLVAGMLYDVRMEYYENGGGAVARLSWDGPSTPREIIPPLNLWPPLFATTPKPANGSIIDERKPALEFMPGLYATNHWVYFSEKFSDVNDRNVSALKYTGTDPCYPYPAVAAPLKLGKTYYWCVDEYAGIENWLARSVWSFTLTDCISLDNMEDYNDRSQMRGVWTDGYADVVWGGTEPFYYLIKGGSSGSNLNASTEVGSPIPGNTGPYNGKQGMVFKYDNDGFTRPPIPGQEHRIYDAPHFSEIEANTVENLGAGSNWEVEGVKALSLWYQGHPGSDGSMAFTLEDPVYGTYRYTVNGYGRDIWSRYDEFYFLGLYPMIGTGSIQAQVISVDNTDPWAKAGVMIREKLTPQSKHAAVFITPGSGVAFQYRATEDGPSTNTNKGGVTAPEHVKLDRSVGGAFQAYHSSDGQYWEDANGANADNWQNITMDPCTYAGFAVTSHTALAICSADFNSFGITGLGASAAWVYGNIGTNDREQMYVALEDTLGHIAVVEHNDINAVTALSPQEWHIKLTDFVGVDFNSVKKFYVGFGDRNDPNPGGSGTVYFDDIRVCPPTCIASFIKPLADIFRPYDCIVNEKDLSVMAGDWLLEDDLITTVAPSEPNLLVRWAFDEGMGTTAGDSSANSNLGTIVGAEWVSPGADGTGSCLYFNGGGDHVIDDSNDANDYMNGLYAVTICTWVKSEVTGTDKGFIIFNDPAGNDSRDIRYDVAGASFGGTNLIKTGLTSTGAEQQLESSSNIQTTNWQHVAITWSSGGLIRLYLDGLEDTPAGRNNPNNTGPLTGFEMLLVGKGGKDTGASQGWQGLIDDVRIYDYALSANEVAYLATNGAPGIHIPIVSDADLYQGEAEGSQGVNFRDFSVIGNSWLEKVTWP